VSHHLRAIAEPSTWYDGAVRVTIDRAGRVVIPKWVRDQVGMTAGEVELVIDGGAVRLEPIPGEGLVDVDGRLTIPATGASIDDELVATLRDADRR